MTIPASGIHTGNDGQKRCWWCGDDPQYMHYHDTEWGRPVHDDRTLFEKLTLESFQSGLSWLTILRKRANLRTAFDNFEPAKVVRYTDQDIARLLNDDGIVRHKGKITAAINNAHRTCEIQQEFGSLSTYIWQYKPDHHTPPATHEQAMTRTTSEEAHTLSKDLKDKGFKFIGPTTCYAFMQAMGLVNDHLADCHIQESLTP